MVVIVRRILLATLVLLLAVAGTAAAAGSVDGARRDVARLEGELGRLDAEAGRVAAAHNAAVDRLARARARVRLTGGRLRQETQRLAHARAALARRAVQLYVNGEPDLVEVLLRTGSVSQVADSADLLRVVARRDAAVVEEVQGRVRRLDELSVTLRESQADGERALARVRDERVRVLALVAERRQRLADARGELRAALVARRARLARLAAAKRAREQELQKARARAAAQRAGDQDEAGPPAQGLAPVTLGGSGGPVFPLAGPTTFSDDWLAPRGSRFHEGIDLFAPRGTPVVAVYDGTLFRVGYSGISGNRLWLRSGDGTEYFYAHLDGFAPAAREGATVRAGTVLGYNGDTGDARGTPTHVHFEIHPGGGGPIRPYPIVSSWPRP